MKKIINLFCVLSCMVLMLIFHVAKTINLKASFEKEEKVYSTATLEDEFADDRVLMVLQKNILKSYTVEDFCGVAEKVRELTDSISTNNRVLCLQLKEKSKQHVLDTINQLSEREDVVYVGPDYKIRFNSVNSTDEELSEQWAYHYIELAKCWEIVEGTTEVIVGVIDTGIDGGHPDFTGVIDTSLSRTFLNDQVFESGALWDPIGHGTHVAGIIGAIENSELGVNGVCKKVKIASLKICNDEGESYASNFADAIVFATQQNIPILNISHGWYQNDNCNDQALDIVLANYKGVVVCAAGNEGVNNDGIDPCYPASLSHNNIISVGAIDSDSNRATFINNQSSNYGEYSVDIFAPGKNIISTFCRNNSNKILDWGTHYGVGYACISGTSMAAPFVTGVVALLLSINPNLTVSQIKTAILESATIPNVNGENPIEELCVSNGVLNAYNAVMYVLKNYPEHEFTLNNINNIIIANENMTSGDNYFYNNNLFYKLNIDTSGSYCFELTSLGDTNVKLYNENFIELSINDSNSSNNIIEITKNLSIGTYYLRAYYNNENLNGTIYSNIHGPHMHQYSYVWKNYYQHKTSCSCGFFQNEAHIISSNSNNIIGQYAKCILCGGDVKTGLVGMNNNSITLLNASNGSSFVLPNGVIVLTNKDIDSYFRGELDITMLEKVEVRIINSDIVIYNKKEEEHYD